MGSALVFELNGVEVQSYLSRPVSERGPGLLLHHMSLRTK